MRFRSYDSLRIFDVVAHRMSFTDAANHLNLTKGAVSYQIKKLEDELGFLLFKRQHRGIVLTEAGKRLWHSSQVAFRDLDREITDLRQQSPDPVTIGMSTYFASRWLSPRLMTFTNEHREIGLRLQPMLDLIDLESQAIDMAIRWGNGGWSDMDIEPLLSCPAFATAGSAISSRIEIEGIAAVLQDVALLHDRQNSDAWSNWYAKAGYDYRPGHSGLVIPDPNVRVQAVIDGQGMALNDMLVNDELSRGRLHKVTTTSLGDYGYFLAYPKGALENPALKKFHDWIIAEATTISPAAS